MADIDFSTSESESAPEYDYSISASDLPNIDEQSELKVDDEPLEQRARGSVMDFTDSPRSAAPQGASLPARSLDGDDQVAEDGVELKYDPIDNAPDDGFVCSRGVLEFTGVDGVHRWSQDVRNFETPGGCGVVGKDYDCDDEDTEEVKMPESQYVGGGPWQRPCPPYDHGDSVHSGVEDNSAGCDYRIVFVSGNAEKVKQLRRTAERVLGGAFGVLLGRLIRNEDHIIHEIQGVGKNQTVDVARHKADEALRVVRRGRRGTIILVEDSGFYLQAKSAKNEWPGAHIKQFLISCGPHMLWSVLDHSDSKAAVAVSSWSCRYILTGHGVATYESNVEMGGRVVAEKLPRDKECFGWDGHFVPIHDSNPRGLTMAQLGPANWDDCNPRSLALREVFGWMKKIVRHW